MIRYRMSALFAVGTSAGGLVAVVPDALAIAAVPTVPSPHLATGTTYDAAHGQVVLFGGEQYCGETWTWGRHRLDQARPGA
jgi:hypothetical protein